MKPNASLWDSCWTDAKIATFVSEFNTQAAESYAIISNAAIAIANGKIAWIGSQADLPAPAEKLAKNLHSAQGRLITPGLIDCHTHLIYAGNRANEFEQKLQGMSYEAIARAGGGIQATVTATRKASEEELLAQSIPRLKALLAEGVTTVEIKSGYGLDTATELKILRVAKKLAQLFPVTIRNTFLGAHTIPHEYKQRVDDYVQLVCEKMLPQVMQENLADAIDVFCETIAFTPAQTEKIFLAAQKYKLPIKIHAEQLSDSSGAKLAAQYHALSADHLEHLSAESAGAMAQSGTVAVLLPGAFYFLREKKLPPIDLLRQYKIPIAIATDCNPGTSPICSLLLIMNMACTLFRLTPEEAWLGVTKHAAKALSLTDSHGTLSVGKTADFVLWDAQHPLDLVYQIGLNPCFKVIKNGQEQTSWKNNIND